MEACAKTTQNISKERPSPCLKKIVRMCQHAIILLHNFLNVNTDNVYLWPKSRAYAKRQELKPLRAGLP